jgi:ribosomal subunit interface protein
MDIVFKGRHTDVQDRFRKHATGKLAKIEKLDSKAIRVDVEVTTEHNPRQSGRREKVELTITTRGPAIRAEAAAEDRFAALDLALDKLESRLRRACDRRKARHVAGPVPAATPPSGAELDGLPGLAAGPAGPNGSRAEPGRAGTAGSVPRSRVAPEADGEDSEPATTDDIIAIEADGGGPLMVREKFHVARPMTIDEALFEMELIGHDFFLFTDATDGLPSVAYRRRGYQYGVIRLVEEAVVQAETPPEGLRGEQSPHAANLR